jgi:hypothetical protein
MVTYEQVVQRIYKLPKPLLQLVLDFIDFLLVCYAKTSNQTDDLNAHTMTEIAISGSAFDWLQDPAEEGIYSDEDGVPV